MTAVEQALAFIEQHGLVAVFIAVFLEQAGAPPPALPVLLLAGCPAAIALETLSGDNLGDAA